MQFITAIPGSINLIFEISLMVKQHLLQYNITADVVVSFTAYRINRLIIDDVMELKVIAGYSNQVNFIICIIVMMAKVTCT